MKLKREGGRERGYTDCTSPLHTCTHTANTANTRTITDAALSIDFLLISIIPLRGKRVRKRGHFPLGFGPRG